MDEWVDGRSDVDLDRGRRDSGDLAGRRDRQTVQEIIVRARPTEKRTDKKEQKPC